MFKPKKKEEALQIREEPQEEEFEEEEFEEEEEPRVKASSIPPVPKKQITVNEVLLNHEERIRAIESTLFRLKSI